MSDGLENKAGPPSPTAQPSTGSSGQLQSRVQDMCPKVLNSNNSLLEVKSDDGCVGSGPA